MKTPRAIRGYVTKHRNAHGLTVKNEFYFIISVVV